MTAVTSELSAGGVTHPPKWALPVVFASCFALSLARDPGALAYPVLMVEDAKFLFGFYYENRTPASIFRFYFGYVSLVPNLVGYFAFFLPTLFVPYLFVLFPMLISSAAFSCFFAAPFRSLVASDWMRFSICLALAGAPMAGSLLIGNTMYSIWSQLLLLALLSLLPLSGRPGALALRGAAMSLIVCSHPGSLVFLPLWIASAARDRSRRAFVFYGALVAVTLVYLTWGVRPTELATPNPLASPLEALQELGAAAVLVIERVAAVASAGVHWTRAGSRSPLGSALLWSSILPLALLLYGLVSGPRVPNRAQLFALVAIGYLIAALTALTSYTRGAGSEEIGRELRYFWIQRELYILLLLSCGFLCLRLRDISLATRGRALFALLLVGWLGLLNYWDHWRYEVRRTAGYQVERFIADIRVQEQRHGDRSRVRARLDRGVFSIVLPNQTSQPNQTSRTGQGAPPKR